MRFSFLEKSRRIVIEFLQDLLHNGLSEHNGLDSDAELLTILVYGSHLAVIQVDNLTMAAQKRCLLFFEIFRIDSLVCFLAWCHS